MKYVNSVTFFMSAWLLTGCLPDGAFEVKFEGVVAQETLTSGAQSTKLVQVVVKSAIATSDDGNLPQNVLDDDLNTRWSADGDAQGLQLSFDGEYLISRVEIAFLKGAERSYSYKFDQYVDGKLSPLSTTFESSDFQEGLIAHDFVSDSPAQGLLFSGYKNSANSWNSVLEVKVYGVKVSKLAANLPALQSSDSDRAPASENPGNETHSGNGDQDQDIEVTAGSFDSPRTSLIAELDYSGFPMVRSGDTIIAGRVIRIEPAASDVRSLQITGQPRVGRAFVYPDNTLALNLSGNNRIGSSISFSYDAILGNGQTRSYTATFRVKDSPTYEGWDQGHNYLLETDSNGHSVFEAGRSHRKVYISDGPNALTTNAIASREGVAVSAVNAVFLASRPSYGSKPSLALSAEAGVLLWRYLVNSNEHSPASHWLLFERGHSYSFSTGLFPSPPVVGESPYHPLLVSSYGSGSRPELKTSLRLLKAGTKNIAFHNVNLSDGGSVFNAENILFENVIFSNGEMNMQNNTRLTIRNSVFHDIYLKKPKKVVDGKWFPFDNRKSGIFVKNTKSLLIERCFFTQNGWAPNYRRDMSISGGHPPSFFSHNLYLQKDNKGMTVRDNIVTEGPSTGMQFRSGGMVEDNIFINNNIGFNVGAGKDKNSTTTVGNNSIIIGNVVTSAAVRRVDDKEGNLAKGIDNIMDSASFLDNIITHLADPNNRNEYNAKDNKRVEAFSKGLGPIYDDTIVFNWQVYTESSPDQNVHGLDTQRLNQTTIQLYTRQLLGLPQATVADLNRYLRKEYIERDHRQVSADHIIQFFRDGFGVDTTHRTERRDVQFIPHPLADGVRWDNRLNWSTQDIPGTKVLDSVYLEDHRVNFSANAKVKDIFIEKGGKLVISGGLLEVTGKIYSEDGANAIEIRGSGKLRVNGSTKMADY